MLPLTGYSDRLSVVPGETVEFKVSCSAGDAYEARLVRVRCGDPNPDSPGMRETPVASAIEGRYPAREQPVHLGSYGRVDDTAALAINGSLTVIATIWPSTPAKGEQGIVAAHDPAGGAGFALLIGEDGSIAGRLADGEERRAWVTVGKPLRRRAWYRVWLVFDRDAGTLAVGQAPVKAAFAVDDEGQGVVDVGFTPRLGGGPPLYFAALGGEPVGGHYNGRIERPMLIGGALETGEVLRRASGAAEGAVLAAWDFARDMSGTAVVDTGPNGLHGTLVNLPARAMRGSNWTGKEMCWRHAPEQYGAIHFHDDDIYDCGWQTDFAFTVPADMPSGVYAARLTCGEADDMIPFFVRPPRGEARSSLCVLVPTFTYMAYGNHARIDADETYRARLAAWPDARPWIPNDHPDYGLSTYNFHSDGSGISHASRLRPLMTMRSGFVSVYDPRGSGLRHFPADTHLIDWLEEMGHDFDVVTDEDLHEEGVDLITRYNAVLTTTHPEYHTRETLDALSAYTERGGRLVYLGANGFYWRVARHRELPGVIELRRAEGGIRAWSAEPGEYYQAFDGAYGGLWRRNARPPQALAGVGFTAQGLFHGSYYRRLTAADDPRAAWIFEGIDDEILGDFGLSGGGAAGFELDRADHELGTPLHALVLASSEGHSDDFILVHEERATHVRTVSGRPASELIRADMTYYETPNGGAVFSVGSITFCGSLSHDGYRNNISRILQNVVSRFRSGGALPGHRDV